MAQLRDIVIDCSHPAWLARSWAAARDGYAVAPYDAEEIKRLRSVGIIDVEDDATVLVEGPGPRLFLQRVPEGNYTVSLIQAPTDRQRGNEMRKLRGQPGLVDDGVAGLAPDTRSVWLPELIGAVESTCRCADPGPDGTDSRSWRDWSGTC